MRRFLITCILIILLTTSAFSGAALDLRDWTVLNYDLSSQAQGVWTLGSGDTIVTQIVNADPTIFLNGVSQSNYTMEGTFRVVSGSDNDNIGFVFGFQDSSHFYVFDWKQENQSPALEGFAVRKIDAISPGSLISNDFLIPTGTNNATVLSSNFNTTSGWLYHTVYDFHLETTPDSFTIQVMKGVDTLWQTTVYDNSYSYGQFGFYNNSQNNVEYVGFKQTSLHIQYVDTTGSDSFGDGTIANPFLTIQHAIDIAQADDTISVGVGVYNEFITIDNKSVILYGREGANSTLIDANYLGDAVTIGVTATQSTKIDGFTIIGGSSYNLSMYEGYATISNCVIDTAGSYPIWVHPQWVDLIDASNTFVPRTNGLFNAIRIGSPLDEFSYVTQSTTWPLPDPGFCYVVERNVQISNSSAILELLPGTVVKLVEGIQATDGAIIADGVLFTSVWDDTLGNSVNHGSSPAAPGQANGISIWSTASNQSTFSNCNFRYLGIENSTLQSYGALTLWQSVDVTNCFFEQNDNSCIYISNSGTNGIILSSTFIDNPGYGIKTENSAMPVIQLSHFNNSALGAVFNTDTSITIDAINNWWGSNIGPYDPTDALSGPPDYNPYGNGDAVSDYVEYRPWIGMSCCLGIRGNVDGDVLDQIDISDLVGLVAYMFQDGEEPSCLEEADIDGSSEIDISDLAGLVAYMFKGGVQPAMCI